VLVGALGGGVINLRSKYGKGHRPLGTERLGFFWSRGLLGDFLGEVLMCVVGIIAGGIILYHLVPFALNFAGTDGFSNATAAIWFFLIVFGLVFARLAFSGLGLLYDLLFGPLKNEGPLAGEKSHGRAGLAPEEKAKAFTGPTDAEPPWADHRYPD